jgi:hypothetical protein
MCTSTNGLKLAAIERVHYFSRQLITADDMTAEQAYFREKLRRHNRYLHGWGVVCGCAVEPYPDATHPWQVRICPGYVITPQGDEILIGAPVNFDLGGDSLQVPDPCANPTRPPGLVTSGTLTQGAPISQIQEEQPVYLAICYSECETRPVRVHPVGCACDESACDYSRIRDSFELVRLNYPLPHPLTQLRIAGPSCPPFTDEQCVILAAIRLPKLRSTPLSPANMSYAERRRLPSVAQLPTSPMVIQTLPGDEATDVLATQQISVWFDHTMDPATVNSRTIIVDSGGPVNGQWSCDPMNRFATFTPQTTPLAPGKYSVTVTHAVKDICGDPVPGNFIWNFVVLAPLLGVVVDGAGNGISAAEVDVLDAAGKVLIAAITGATGHYVLSQTDSLTTGSTYGIRVNLPFGAFTKSNPASQPVTWQGTEITLNNFVLS